MKTYNVKTVDGITVVIDELELLLLFKDHGKLFGVDASGILALRMMYLMLRGPLPITKDSVKKLTENVIDKMEPDRENTDG